MTIRYGTYDAAHFKADFKTLGWSFVDIDENIQKIIIGIKKTTRIFDLFQV